MMSCLFVQPKNQITSSDYLGLYQDLRLYSFKEKYDASRHFTLYFIVTDPVLERDLATTRGKANK